MIYFIHLHHVTLLGQRLGETLLWRFRAQFYFAPLQKHEKVERGIVIQQPLYSREKLTDSAVYVSVTSLLQILDQCDLQAWGQLL